jgi:hypothetical protein
LAEEGREIPDDNKRWDDRTERMTFELRKGNKTVHSVWTKSVRNAVRKQARGRERWKGRGRAVQAKWTVTYFLVVP